MAATAATTGCTVASFVYGQWYVSFISLLCSALSLTALLGKKRSADEADVATREDTVPSVGRTLGLRRNVKGGLKVRVSSLLGRL
jgi:hypothetical protein